ncbi:hypothetical protein MHYP_G00306950 [Metynnis hypsauchen]
METRKRRCIKIATALSEPEAEPRGAAGQCSTETDQSSAKTKDYPSAVLDLQKVKAQLKIEKTKCSFLEDNVKELQADKAFLQSPLTSPGKGQSSSVKTMAGVISRYKKALKYYKEAESIQRAFDCLGVDRNTACTAPITELSISSPDVFCQHSME